MIVIMSFDINEYIENNKKGFIEDIGIEILEISTGFCKGRIKLEKRHQNPLGTVHGGCLFTLADTIGGLAAISHGYQVVTLNSEIHYLNPAVDTTCIIATSKEIKFGKHTSVYEVSITNDKEQLVATTTLTYFCLYSL